MNKELCKEATTLLLDAVTQEKQARANQLRAILSLAQNYTAAIDDDLLDELIEQTVPRGSVGTTPISEFAHLELGPLMGCSPVQAKTILFETLNLYHRHRSLWDAVQDLTLDAHRARRAAGKFGVLSPDLAEEAGRAWVARQHRLSWQGAIDLCDKLIIAADPVIAAEREARRLRNRNVRIWEQHEATINLTATLDPLDAKYVDATVSQIAGILKAKPEYTQVALDVLRAKALGIMAHPALALAMVQGALQQPLVDPGEHDAAHGEDGEYAEADAVPVAKLQPKVQLYIHLNPDGTATIEDVGTVAASTLTELLDGKQVRATPVIDLNSLPAEHQYRPSRRLKEATHLVFPREAFPFSNRSSRGLDLDHKVAYQRSCRDPQTALGNLGPFGRRVHRGKTAGFWKCHQPRPGQLIWTSPLGYRYVVDKDGTHRLE